MARNPKGKDMLSDERKNKKERNGGLDERNDEEEQARRRPVRRGKEKEDKNGSLRDEREEAASETSEPPENSRRFENAEPKTGNGERKTDWGSRSRKFQRGGSEASHYVFDALRDYVPSDEDDDVTAWRTKTKPEDVYKEYTSGEEFNESIELYDNVERNNDFYNGKQWGDIKAPHLDKPCVNIIKPAINYYIAQLVSDNISTRVQIEDEMPGLAEEIGKVIQEEISNVMEINNMASKNRQLLKNMAIDGDMVLYSYYNIDSKVIDTEIVNNTDLIFGNPIEQEIQKQPYLIHRQRMLLNQARELAEANDGNPDEITADNDTYFDNENERDLGNDYTTVYNKFWKQNGMVWCTRVTANAVIKEPVNLGLTLYPFSYQSWERVKGSYHGESPVSGVIPNQILINKMLAAASAYNLNYAFPKVLYDRTKLPQGWNNDPTKAIPCVGDPNTAIFSTFKPSDMSEQVVALITKVTEDTKTAMGVYDAALGNVNPNNTSAIVATQKAASAPLDLQRLDFYQMVEDTVRIWLDIMAVSYGVRPVNMTVVQDGEERQGLQMFPFSVLRNLKYRLRIDIGASTYWSELTQMQTLDNLMNLQILPDATTYLELLPKGQVPNRDKVIERIRQKEQQAMMAQQQAQQRQMAAEEEKARVEREGKAIENANKQAELMTKMRELQERQTLVNRDKLSYPENELAGAGDRSADNVGSWGWD